LKKELMPDAAASGGKTDENQVKGSLVAFKRRCGPQTRALLKRLRSRETGEFAIVEPLVNVLATNVFQVHHGGRHVFVAEPFLVAFAGWLNTEIVQRNPGSVEPAR
jgi:hypothetical protein